MTGRLHEPVTGNSERDSSAVVATSANFAVGDQAQVVADMVPGYPQRAQARAFSAQLDVRWTYSI